MDKEALVANQSMAYLNYEKVLGESVVHEYAHNISGKLFYYSKTNTYLVQYGKLFEAIDRLKLNPENHLIISLGLFLEYYRSEKLLKQAEADDVADYRYNGIPIYSFNYAIPPEQAGLYVMNTDDKPMLKHHSWKTLDVIEPETKNYWERFDNPIDEKLHDYFKTTEAGNEDPSKESDTKTKNKENLQNKVELTVDFLASCWFKNKTKVLFLKEGEPGQEGGNVRPMSEIKPL